jgi:hypothetical protein
MSASNLSYAVWALGGLALLVLWGLTRSRRTVAARPAQVVARMTTQPVLRVLLVVGFMFLGWHVFAR